MIGQRVVWMLGLALGLACACRVYAQPLNDDCGSATAITSGATVVGTAFGASNDGNSDCNLELVGDVYHSFVPPVAGIYTFTLCAGTNWDTVLSMHVGCPADVTTQVGCDDEGCRPSGSVGFGFASSLTIVLPAGVSYIVRISGYDEFAIGDVYSLRVIGPTTPTGACCLSGVCSVQTGLVCTTAGGSYRGNYTACEAPSGIVTYYTPATVPLMIPDNAPAGVSSAVTVADGFTIGDVRLELEINHTFVGDLSATLTHGGRVATLFKRIGGGSTGDDSNLQGLYTFSDTGAQTIWTGAIVAFDTLSVITNGPYRAVDEYANTVSLRSVFTGFGSEGTWTLNITDNAPFDTGTIVNWRLVLQSSAGDVCDASGGACCVGSICQIAVPGACVGPGLSFAGTGVACNAQGDNFVPCCRADFGHNGTVSVQDLFDYLAAYFQGLPTADFGGGGLSLQDLFDYLGGFFTGCP